MDTIEQIIFRAFADIPLLVTLDIRLGTCSFVLTDINHTSWASISWRTFTALAAMTFFNQSYCLN